MKNQIFYIFFVGILLTTSCQKRALCPAYVDRHKGTVSKQDAQSMSAEELRGQSLKLLDAQDTYIQVKRDKTTGLIKGKRRVKKNKNNNLTDRGFGQDPRVGMGMDTKQSKPKLNSSEKTK